MVEVDGSKAFGALVRAHRRRLGLTQEELATKAGLSTRSIVKLESGRVAVPRPPTVRLLALVFGLTGADAEEFHRCGAGVTTESGPAVAGRVPAQLPPDVSAFTGRGAQLAELDAMAAAAADQPTAVFVAVVTGPAGVGKTALAVRWAHHVRDRFPGGQLHVNLRGYDPARPMTAADVLTRFLTALGVPAQDVPVDVDDRAARFRTELADRRVLVLLDNAASTEQVRPLLPGTASSTVLVTSRDTLPGLVAVDGAQRVEVDLLSPGDAHALLRRLIGPRARSAPGAVATLAEQCARLPLALRVAAELIAARPDAALDDLVDELCDQRRRLAALAAGEDPRASVPAVLSWSIQHLPPGAARTFCLLGLHPGPDFDAHAVASLTGDGPVEARGTLELLARAHLVHRTGPGRFGMHDLLRAYAVERVERPANGPRERMFDYYRATAAAARDALFPADHRPVPAAATPSPDLTDRAAARAWLDAERAALLAIVAETATGGWPAHAVHLSWTLVRYLAAGQPSDAVAVHGHALDAALATGDPVGEAETRTALGAALLRHGRPTPAAVHLERATALFAELGDPAGEARAAINHGLLDAGLSRLAPAAGRFEHALRLFRQAGDRIGEARALNALGLVEERLGDHGPAEEHQRQALLAYEEVGSPMGVAAALTDLGIVAHRLGRTEEAAEHHRQALALFLDGRDRLGEAWARNGLGEAALTLGDPAAALTHHTAALAAATVTDARDQQARAHLGLGDAQEALHDPARARTHHEQAVTLFTDLGMPEADTLRARLTPRPPGR
ncbi:tetratricopeptide repeat protein [Dactylosporangium sp. NPDC005555]|uniref:ATP-binding protein n=1 Tax=Dactylosporangium sp. NPDC005555 TaxID=3154889 RepID=UPI0033B759DC